MSENWRKKKYYGPRVLIETERILDTQFDGILICLSGAQVEMLRNLTQYLHYRSTFAQGYTKQYYLAPSNDDWETIQGVVGDLEEKLMSSCIDELVDAVEAQTVVLDAMMQCVCAISNAQNSIMSRLPDLTGYVDEGLLNYQDEQETRGTPGVPGTDEAKCEIAQAMYYYIFDVYVVDLLPFANSTADTLTAAIVATSTFALLGGFLGLPVAIAGYVVSGIIAWGIDGSIATFTSWLLAIKNEYICALYNAYPDYDAAHDAVVALIDADETISFLDKVVARSIMASSWHMTWVAQDQQTNGTWDAFLVSGQCDECEPPDPECAVLDCESENWSGIPPGGLGCESGSPYALNANPIRWGGGSPTQPASGFKLQVNWTALGDSGSAILGCNLISDGTDTQIGVSPPASQPVGETKTSEWDLSSPGTIGEGLDIRLSQASWYGVVNWYCIRSL